MSPKTRQEIEQEITDIYQEIDHVNRAELFNALVKVVSFDALCEIVVAFKATPPETL